MNRLKLAIVSCGFLGCAPFAPGTVGTLGGVAIVWLLARTEHYLVWTLLVAAALYAVGRALGAWAEEYAAGKDPQFFVLDEVVGYLVACLWTSGPNLLALTVAFFLFRLFDIVKPPPARRFEGIGGGDGILLDDVVAGVYAFVVMLILRVVLPLEPEGWTVPGIAD